MGFLRKSATLARGFRASTPGHLNDVWYQTPPEGWTLSLEAAGVDVTPELALTLSHVYCAVSTISDDLGTASCQMFRDLGDQGRARVQYRDPGVGALAYQLRWQPNSIQTAKAFWSTMAWQYLLRPSAYAEILYRPGSDIIEGLEPRHPDRVAQERLPSGRLRYRLTEANGTPRYVTQEEMFVVRNTSTDGLNAISRTRYGSKALASGIALQEFTRKYFQKGATASLIGKYKDDMEESEVAALHTSISRYMSGVDNAGGLLLINANDLDIASLGVDPEKAQLLGLKNLSGRDVARLFKMPPSWLGIEGASAYNSQVQDATNYVNRCQIPMAVEFEQAIKRDLIVKKEQFFAKFNLDYMLRGDLKTRAESYEIMIRSRVIRPSEARVSEDMAPDDRLDELSESDYRPGTSGTSGGAGEQQPSARAVLKANLAIHDHAQRVVRRERIAVTKLAQKYPADVGTWQKELRAFYTEHASFVAETMRIAPAIARAYAAQHGSEIEALGIAGIDETWERYESGELAALAVTEGERIGG